MTAMAPARSAVVWGALPASRRVRRAVYERFDGNHADSLDDWMVAVGSETFIGVTEKAMEQLVGLLIENHLAWVVIPPAGYRL